MGKEGFKGLKVWEKGKNLAVHVYQITDQGQFAKDFSLRDQIRRAAVSIASNIAEGDELGTDKQSVRHFLIAKGSAAEVITQAEIASEIAYISVESCKYISDECTEILKMLSKLILVRSKNLKGMGSEPKA